MDLFFENAARRAVEYNARASVQDFDAEMDRCHQLAVAAKSRVAGIHDVAYGPAKAERLDVFPAQGRADAPLFVFIHGGYWHSQTKADAASMAAEFVQRGISVACLEYSLLPQATLPEAMREVRSAIAHLHAHASLLGFSRDRIVVAGSSAGGHLAACLLQGDWQDEFGLPPDVIKGGVLLSGLYDLRPLTDIYVNDWLRMTEDQARDASPMFKPVAKGLEVVLAVGELETTGFRHQTEAMLQTYRNAGITADFVEGKGCNHFSLVNQWANPDSRLFAVTTALLERVCR